MDEVCLKTADFFVQTCLTSLLVVLDDSEYVTRSLEVFLFKVGELVFNYLLQAEQCGVAFRLEVLVKAVSLLRADSFAGIVHGKTDLGEYLLFELQA